MSGLRLTSDSLEAQVRYHRRHDVVIQYRALGDRLTLVADDAFAHDEGVQEPRFANREVPLRLVDGYPKQLQPTPGFSIHNK